MPTEIKGRGEQDTPTVPNMKLAQLKFAVAQKASNADAASKELMEAIKTDDMAPFYLECVKDLPSFKEDKKLTAKMTAANEAELTKLDAAIANAEKNEGESELREAWQQKAEYLTKIGNKEESLKAIDRTLEKTVGVGNRMDCLFHRIRIGLFYSDHALISTNIEKAKVMLEEGGDWDRRNRLKVYRGFYAMSVRDFETCASLFLETISTFTSYELMTYVEFVTYTVYSAMIALDRRRLNDKVVSGSEILEVLHNEPHVKQYLFSLYDCQYEQFFVLLAKVEQFMKGDRYLNAHYAYYVREMKVKVFGQLLESYRSLTLKYMAEAFNVTEDYMDRELSRFIADGRLHCRIDKVRGIVITNRPDSKNAQYQSTIKQGDILLNRVQKLSRVINI